MYKKYIRCFFIIILMTVIFKTNCIDDFNITHNEFQYESEDLVIGIIGAKHYDIATDWYNLGTLMDATFDYDKVEGYDKLQGEQIYLQNRNETNNLYFKAYGSQIGIQGYVYGFISKNIYSKYLLEIFRWINCILLSLVIMSICIMIKLKYNKYMAFVWMFVFIFSPWIVNFSPNLYWVEFLWFLPLMLGLYSVTDVMMFRYKRQFIYVCAFLCIFLKAGCGYEYLSTILISMILFPTVDFINYYFVGEYEKSKQNLIDVLIIGLCGMIGFVMALGLHAYYRGGYDVYQGLQNIYKYDVLRRTALGSVDNFSSDNTLTMQSVNATILEVLARYWNYYSNAYNYNIILGLDGRWFKFISISSFLLITCEVYKTRNSESIKLLSMLIISFIASISWFVLAKSHSFIHIHMNYVLWFFGFVQISIYIIVRKIINFIK